MNTIPASQPVPGLRERKKAELRRNLQDAALRLAAEHGFERLTVEAIAQAADVSTRTFFNYFSSKEEALLAPNPDAAEHFTAELLARPAGEPPLEAIRAVLMQTVARMADRRDIWHARVLVVEQNPQLMPRMTSSFFFFERALATAIAARLGTDPFRDPYTAVLATATNGAMRCALMQWRDSSDVSLETALGAMFDLLAGGLDPPPAEALIAAPTASPERAHPDLEDHR